MTLKQSCSFCGIHEDDKRVRIIIATEDAAICETCVANCVIVLAEELAAAKLQLKKKEGK